MSDPDENYGPDCVYCGQDHPRRGGCPEPDPDARAAAADGCRASDPPDDPLTRVARLNTRRLARFGDETAGPA